MSTQQENIPFSINVGENPDLEIIWLHGWGQTHNCFLALAELYKNKAKNTLVDLYGFGKTPLLFKNAGTDDYAQALAKSILSEPKTKKRIIIGHSFGCRVAVRLAQIEPSLADGYVLISAAGLKRKRSLVWKLKASYLKLLGKTAGLCDKMFNTGFKAEFSKKFGSSDYKNAGELRETFVRVVNEDLSAEAAKVKEPVLLIYGDEDQDTPVELG
ncbi:MAG: alpha/beta hydrolase, partial [Sphingomonadales bacterium]|nr:alpha/beta hydrolase [Sphingomonadales bacterium]